LVDLLTSQPNGCSSSSQPQAGIALTCTSTKAAIRQELPCVNLPGILETYPQNMLDKLHRAFNLARVLTPTLGLSAVRAGKIVPLLGTAIAICRKFAAWCELAKFAGSRFDSSRDSLHDRKAVFRLSSDRDDAHRVRIFNRISCRLQKNSVQSTNLPLPDSGSWASRAQ
jgi:hypothetical protein